MSQSVQPVYLLVDGSGSMNRLGYSRAVNEALPSVVDAFENDSEVHYQIAILRFTESCETVLALTDAGALNAIPVVAAAGLSGLAGGVAFLGNVLARDAAHASVDGVDWLPIRVALITDGLPTDSPDDLRIAYQEMCARVGDRLGDVLIVLPDATVTASVAGLGQGRARPRVDVVDLPIVDAELLAMVLGGWLTRPVTG